jgi:hypothetical protein
VIGVVVAKRCCVVAVAVRDDANVSGSANSPFSGPNCDRPMSTRNFVLSLFVSQTVVSRRGVAKQGLNEVKSVVITKSSGDEIYLCMGYIYVWVVVSKSRVWRRNLARSPPGCSRLWANRGHSFAKMLDKYSSVAFYSPTHYRALGNAAHG